MSQEIQRIVERLGTNAQRFSGKTILLAGGAGFLGKHFLKVFQKLNQEVLHKPCKVISVDNYITGTQNLDDSIANDPQIMQVWADVTHPLPVREDIDFIIHGAGIASPVYYMRYPLETIESAVHGTRNLLNLAASNKELEGFLFFSSSEIYGDPDPRAVPIKEDYYGNVSTVGPRACYDESKRLGETLCTIYQEHHGVPTKIVRPFNVFGPGMGHNDRRVIPMFTYQSLNGRTIPVHGTGLQTRTFCYITDAIYGFLMTLLQGELGEAYNIGNPDNEISMNELAAMYPRLVPGATFSTIDYPDTYPAGEPNRRCPDITKARETFGYTAEVNVEDGLHRFIDWARHERSYIDFEPDANVKLAG
ncbi:NAD-dependent epimerase/dehydratase family protein [Phaeobacter gallaeciensis]|uniref:dTDP-D-glucose 4,6-dehydratase-like protein n=1 Tax=Phaeobacter gallaeciensis TaxID=60890 RepID=A0AAC9Z6I1_9RHOB|nr:NAD-dependent epimerase/dehydratase family protein [Phaeobacter gallaeciensis]AHD08358.1 Nucleoside-diphosphate-sugar epimerase [Phaeobacter gallaeciensis DSM 26640]ATE91624.1 dTDP-D-glucose 4,6-dehydratase-like protein [Phaeobacter gallaeciensis]ATE98552.1 dTDP-D-glucose 4,6-dehydratase-like protein [Phaeobacter gallaeciensis]ATF00240.1 dTDP-D-glucose 4,6-dehydratase-like protein [Phaeobacter gallaeciensis]ATF04672.1 dTDP-D-glucose 4,6-dehydratase-like protein [Phaeobacter gallaeciensis]